MLTNSLPKVCCPLLFLYLPLLSPFPPSAPILPPRSPLTPLPGYYTIIPDLFNKDQLPVDRPFDLFAWLEKGSTGTNPHTLPYIDAIVEKALAYLHAQGYTQIGAVGYCFGAKYVVRHMSAAKGAAIKVGYGAHPVRIPSPFFRRILTRQSFVDEEELAAILGPFSISAAQTDSIFPAEKRHKSEEILIKTGQPWQINLYSGVDHGYAVRADLSDKWQKWTKEQAFEQAVRWFDYHL